MTPTVRRGVWRATVAWGGAQFGIDVLVGRPGWVTSGAVVVVGLVVLARQGGTRAVLGALVLLVVVGSGTARSLAGLDRTESSEVVERATLLTDPRPDGRGGRRAEARLDGDRVLLRATTPRAAAALAAPLAGERVLVVGTRDAIGSSSWSRSRHLAAEVDVVSVEPVHAGSPLAVAANTIRRRLVAGAASLPEDRRTLLTGVIFGDDRGQRADILVEFRASGLSHLTAVSGQNVAFVLAVAAPVLRRLGLWPRYVAAVLVVLAFAFLTRFEPSVLRASAMAIVALSGMLLDTDRDGRGDLAVAITVLVVVDPLVTESLGFRLSVAATVGVLWIAPRIVERWCGPSWLVLPAAVTVGAQVAVAPVLLPVAGPMPLAAVPANLLAGPLAAVIMLWGLPAGAVAAMLVDRWPAAAAALHLPTDVTTGALLAVADWGARMPLGSVDWRTLAFGAGGVLLVAAVGRTPGLALTGCAVLVAVALAASRPAAPPPRVDAGWAAEVWGSGHAAVVVAARGSRVEDLLEGIRAVGAREVAVLVLRSSDPDLDRVARAVGAALPVGLVVGPAAAPGAEPRALVVGDLVVHVDPRATPVRVVVGRR